MRPPASWAQARLTLAIAAVTAAAWLVVAVLGRLEWAAIWGGFIPLRATLGEDGSVAPFWLTPLTATLVHAGLIHLVFNLIMLTFCGRHVEWVLGPAAIAILYLVGAYAAAGGQYLADPHSAAPMIGASGAISAVIGAYAVLFGRNKVKVAGRRLALALNALWLLAAWVGLNLIVGIIVRGGLIPGTGPAMTIAVAAHIGGFIPGLLLAIPLLKFRYRKA
ncbi:MAG TPA: rhomboid family intramembrane serine protease [Allosphingosinicella sp.]|nr:rhomboid family intramembrane serine protease [Allosphingosinicella sp.]